MRMNSWKAGVRDAIEERGGQSVSGVCVLTGGRRPAAISHTRAPKALASLRKVSRVKLSCAVLFTLQYGMYESLDPRERGDLGGWWRV
jgi:hypothetical protein